MAVFVSASDESAGRNRLDQFLMAGWVADESLWANIFTPAWQRLVLDGPPKINYLHMTEIRSKAWRGEQGLTDEDADHRVDESIAILGAADFIYPIGVTVEGEDICKYLASAEVTSRTRSSRKFEPDFLCFLAYAQMALIHVARHHPECEKLDFVIERNGRTAPYIQDFHSVISLFLRRLGRADLGELVGKLIPSSKEGIPVQAADVLCWHTARARNPSRMDAKDVNRYQTLSQKNGWKHHIDSRTVMLLAESLINPS